MNNIPKDIDRLVAGALTSRLGLERLVDETVRLGDCVGGARPGRKVLSLVASMLVGGSHIDHADMLRAGLHRQGAVVSGDGPVHIGHVSSCVHMGSCPPDGQGPG